MALPRLGTRPQALTLTTPANPTAAAANAFEPPMAGDLPRA
jgi:hypothetical protein